MKNTKNTAYIALISIGMASLFGCSTIESIGNLGPNNLKVYSVSSSNFLNSSQMIVVLDKKGDVSAYAGGTSAGYGAVGLQTLTSATTAGAVIYGANAIKNGLHNTSSKVIIKAPII